MNAVVNIYIVMNVDPLTAEQLAQVITGAGEAGPCRLFGEVREAMLARAAAALAAQLRTQAALLEARHPVTA